nr:MAG TPA: hypothetical protein [Bacteriophage sp.]
MFCIGTVFCCAILLKHKKMVGFCKSEAHHNV